MRRHISADSTGRRRRTVSVLAAGLLAGSLLAACSSSSGSGNSSGPIHLKFSSYAWQDPTVKANKSIVAAWNKSHPNIQIDYQPVDADSVHDKLVTAFSSNSAPDIIHDEAADIAGFAQQGYLTDLKNEIPADLKSDVPQGVWDSVTFNGGIFGVPSLLQSYVVFANKKVLQAAGIAEPTQGQPWTWDQFQQAAKKLTTGGRYGLAWALKAPVSVVLSLSLNFDGKYFDGTGSSTSVKFDQAEQEVPRRIHDMIFQDKSLAPNTVGLGGADVLPGFYAGKYAMFVGGNFFAQQLVQQAPKGFDWVMLPPLKGISQNQTADPQTYSIARQSKHPKEAMQFLDYFLSAQNLADLAQGDWLAPATGKASTQLLKQTTGVNGWQTVVGATKDLVPSPTAQVANYPQWKTEIATPAFQQYFAGKIDLPGLGNKLISGWKQVAGH